MGCQRLWGLREIKYNLIVYLIVLKLDRTYSTSGNLFEQKEEVTHYVGMSKEKIEGSISSFVLVDERLSVELILDGHHVPFNTASEIVQAIGDRIVLVTDAMAAAGSVDGNYTIGKLAVTVQNSVARLQSNGALAGSTLTMDKAFVNAINECGVSIEQAVSMCSTNPAKALGVKDRGSIEVGMRADLLSYNSTSGAIKVIS